MQRGLSGEWFGFVSCTLSALTDRHLPLPLAAGLLHPCSGAPCSVSAGCSAVMVQAGTCGVVTGQA